MRQAALIIALLSIGAGSLLHGMSLEGRERSKTLTIGVYAEEAPELFSSSADGGGLEREMLTAFARLHDRPLRLKTYTDAAQAIQWLNGNEVDVVAGLFATEERRALLGFTEPVLTDRCVVVTVAPHANIHTLPALQASRIGIWKGSVWAEIVGSLDVPASRLKVFGSEDSLFGALRNGSIDATLYSVMEALLNRRRMPDLQIGLGVGKPMIYSWAIRKDDAVLRDALNEYLQGVHSGGTWSRLVVKYFGDAPQELLGR